MGGDRLASVGLVVGSEIEVTIRFALKSAGARTQDASLCWGGGGGAGLGGRQLRFPVGEQDYISSPFTI